MNATCPAGHVSQTTDWCDQCGARIDAPATPPDTSATRATNASAVSAPCPRCGTPRSGQDRFCEDCGFDFSRDAALDDDAGTGPAWAATVAPDREHFARVGAAGLPFPDGERARTIALDGARVRIGRRRSAAGDAPEIEVADPAVSRLHASLVQNAGGWAVVDEGSANGTTVNADPDPIPPHVEVPLGDGDRIHVGAWTTITLASRPDAAA